MSPLNSIINHTGNILDLVISKCYRYSVSNAELNIDETHPVLNISIEFKNIEQNIYYSLNYPDYQKYDFYNSDYTIINAELRNIDWKEIFNELELNKALDEDYNI